MARVEDTHLEGRRDNHRPRHHHLGDDVSDWTRLQCRQRHERSPKAPIAHQLAHMVLRKPLADPSDGEAAAVYVRSEQRGTGQLIFTMPPLMECISQGL